MSRRKWTAAVGAVLSVTLMTSSPASAGSEGLSKQAQTAASIDDLRASDSELVKALETLDKEVATQQIAVDTAHQAVEAANQAMASNEKDLADLQVKLDVLQGEATARAVEEYMRPHDDVIGSMLSSDGFEDVSRRGEFLHQVGERDLQALEDLRDVKSELDRERRSAVAARDIASDREKEERKKLDDLNVARADKQRLEQSLQARIKAYAEEDDASERVQSQSQGGRASRSSTGSDDDSRISASGLKWPVPDHRINSPFGTRWGRLHAGVDIEAKMNTPISAAKAGTVTYAGWESGYGNYTCIDHGGGFSTCYGHQTKILVSVGATVSQGQLIGYSGNTGSSGGPHLHFETRVNGAPRDPMQYLP